MRSSGQSRSTKGTAIIGPQGNGRYWVWRESGLRKNSLCNPSSMSSRAEDGIIPSTEVWMTHLCGFSRPHRLFQFMTLFHLALAEYYGLHLAMARQQALGAPLMLPPRSVSAAGSSPYYHHTSSGSPSPLTFSFNDAASAAAAAGLFNPYDYAAYNPALAQSLLTGEYSLEQLGAVGGFFPHWTRWPHHHSFFPDAQLPQNAKFWYSSLFL